MLDIHVTFSRLPSKDEMEEEKYFKGMAKFVFKTDRSDVSVSDRRSGSNSLDRQL